MVITDPALLVPDTIITAGKKRYHQPLLNPLATIKQWFRGPNKQKKRPATHVNFAQPAVTETVEARNYMATTTSAPPILSGPNSAASGSMPPSPMRGTHHSRPRLATRISATSQRRPSSQSSSPITPQSSYYRRNPGAIPRGRTSTSSSVSSAPDVHAHRPTHSKTSSASSSSLTSPHLSNSNLAQRRSIGKAPVKVLPAPFTATTLPSHVRVVRSAPQASVEGTAAFSTMAPPSPGLLFAKRKRTPFKGPMLGPGVPGHRRRSEPHGPRSRSNSVTNRHGGEVPIQEEDEEIEEVDYFSPVTGPGEFVAEDQFPPAGR